MSTGPALPPANSNDRPDHQGSEPAAHEMFSSGRRQSASQEHSWISWAVAASVVILGLGLLALLGRSHTVPLSPQATTLQPSPYASNLECTDIHLSQAENFAGSQVTYVDGTIANHGNQTVVGITVAATFANDAGEQPQIETLPLLLIRMHEPYIDTQSVSAAPLAPGDTREFRLIFDDISQLWDQKPPELHVLGVQLAQRVK